MENSTLDDSDPMFNDMDNGFTPRRSFTGMPRAVSQGDVLGQEHSRAKQDNPHSMPDADQSTPLLWLHLLLLILEHSCWTPRDHVSSVDPDSRGLERLRPVQSDDAWGAKQA